MRLLQSILSSDPDRTGMPAPWENRPVRARESSPEADPADLSQQAMQSALAIGAEAAGLPGALIKTLNRSVRNETSTLALYAPRTILNQPITAARRFAAQGWPLERLRAIGRATGTTMNDVVLAMCSGAMRTYLLELDALPDQTLISMVPVGLKAKESHLASVSGGNALGAVMVKLGTDLPDPADRLQAVHDSMVSGKRALAQMTPVQILAMSALGQAPAILGPMLKMSGLVRPPYNLIISNVPGPRTTQYFNGMRLEGTYPLSIPIDGMALNITCNSYAGQMAFGLTGCRRTVPHLQRLLTYLDSELGALERAAGS
jgi:diacylglycerol O-acyltransferase